jgi:hypothetical protein
MIHLLAACFWHSTICTTRNRAMTTDDYITLLVMILGLLTAVLYLGKGYFDWDAARLKNELQKRRKRDKGEEDDD